MAELSEYLDDIKLYTKTVDEKAVQGMAKTYAGVMAKADSRFVAASDEDEVQRVVDNFCMEKLGRKEDEETIWAAVEAQLEKMKGVRRKSRLTVYYLIAEHYNQLSLFYSK